MVFKKKKFPATMHLSALAFIASLAVSSVAFVLESCPETGVSFDYSYYSCVNDTHIEKKKGVCSGSVGTLLMEEKNTYACGEFHEADFVGPFSPKLNTCITCSDTGKAVCVSNSSEEVEVCEFARTAKSGPFFDGNLKLNFNRCGSLTPSEYREVVQYKSGPNSWGGNSENNQFCSTDDRKFCVECNNSMQLCSSANATCTEIFEGFFSPTSEAIMFHRKSNIATYFLFAVVAHSFFLTAML